MQCGMCAQHLEFLLWGTTRTHRMNSTPSAMPTRSTQVPDGGTVLTRYCLSCLHGPSTTPSAGGGDCSFEPSCLPLTADARRADSNLA